MRHLIELRWIAVAGQITTIATVTLGFGVQLPLPAMLQVLACLIAFNIFSLLRWQEERIVTNSQVFLGVVPPDVARRLPSAAPTAQVVVRSIKKDAAGAVAHLLLRFEVPDPASAQWAAKGEFHT